MADAYTNTTTISNLVQTAYDRALEFQLRDMPLFRNFADKRPVQQTAPGTSIVFQLYNDLAEQTGTLTEGTDPDAIAVGNTSTVTVTLAEYGAAVLETRKLSAVALSDVDPAIVDMVTRNCVASIDTAAQTVVRGGTHYIRKNSGTIKTDAALSSAGTGTTVLTTSTDIFSSAMARLAVTKLRALKATRVRATCTASCFTLRLRTTSVRRPAPAAGARRTSTTPTATSGTPRLVRTRARSTSSPRVATRRLTVPRPRRSTGATPWAAGPCRGCRLGPADRLRQRGRQAPAHPPGGLEGPDGLVGLPPGRPGAFRDGFVCRVTESTPRKPAPATPGAGFRFLRKGTGWRRSLTRSRRRRSGRGQPEPTGCSTATG
jgi:hypothetical protein